MESDSPVRLSSWCEFNLESGITLRAVIEAFHIQADFDLAEDGMERTSDEIELTLKHTRGEMQVHGKFALLARKQSHFQTEADVRRIVREELDRDADEGVPLESPGNSQPALASG